MTAPTRKVPVQVSWAVVVVAPRTTPVVLLSQTHIGTCVQLDPKVIMQFVAPPVPTVAWPTLSLPEIEAVVVRPQLPEAMVGGWPPECSMWPVLRILNFSTKLVDVIEEVWTTKSVPCAEVEKFSTAKGMKATPAPYAEPS